jgi:hypothetical protein
MKPGVHLVMLMAVCVLTHACSPPPLDPPDTSSASADTPDVAQDLPADPMHCGESDVNCVGPLGIGDCVNGECQGQLFNCWTTSTTCADACVNEADVTCAEAGCDGATAFGWGLQTHDESLAACVWADEDTATPLTVACDEPLPFDDYPAISCCCKW